MATITAIFNAQDNLSKAMANAGNAGSKTTGIMQKLGKIGSVAMKGIITAVTAAGTALLALGKKAVSTGMNFETSMSQVMATMGVNRSTAEGEKAYQTLSAAAEKMGAETAFTASQAADALNYLALAGYDADKAAQALPTVLHLAGAGAMDLATASDMVTDSMAALQLEVNQTNLDRFADQMAKTASTTNTSVSQLGEAILTVGATAANLRNGTTELNTQLGILANVGIKGSEGGTHLRNILLRLQSPTDKAAKQLNKLGVAVYDTDGKMRDTGTIFEDLKNSMAGMDQNEIDKIMSTIFNKTDLAAAQALLAGAGDEYARIFDIIENSGGAAAEMYQTMLDNLKGDVDIFNSATEALYIALYKNINGTLRNLVQTGTGYMNRLLDAFNAGGFEGLVSELGNVLGDATGVIMSYAPKLVQAGTGIVMAFVESIGDNADTIAEAAADIAIELGSAIVKIAPKLVQAFGKVLAAVGKAALSAIPKLFKSIPDSIYNAFGLDKSKVMPKIYAFAGFMRSAIAKLFSGDIFGSVDSIGRAFNIDTGTLDKVKGILTSIGSAFSKVWGFAQKAATAIGGFLGKFASIGGVQATLAGLVTGFAALKAINIGKNFMSMAKGVKKAGGAMKAIGKVLVANKFLLIAAAIAAVVAGIVLLVKNWDKVKKAIGSGIDKVFGAGTFDKLSQSMSKVGEGFKKVGDWAKTSFGKMKDAFGEGYKNGGLFGGISAAFGSLKESLSGVNWGEIGSKAWEGIKSGFSATGDWIKSLVLGDSYTPDASWGDVGSKIWESIKNGITATGDWLKDKLGYTPDDSWGTIGSDIWEKVKGGISATGDWLKEKLGYTPDESWSSIGSDIWEKVKSGISATGDWLKEKLGYTPDTSWSTIGSDIWTTIQSGISATGDWIKQKVLGDSYTPDASWSTVGTTIWDKIWSGITDAGAKLKEKLSEALGKIPQYISELLGGGEAGETAEGILTSIGSAFEQSFGTITSALEPLKTAFEEIGEKLSNLWTKLTKGGDNGAPSALQVIGNALLTVGKVVLGVFGAVGTVVVGVVNGIINALGPLLQAFASVFGAVIDVVTAVVQVITGDFSGAWESIKSALSGVWNGIKSIGQAIANFFQGIWAAVSGVIGAISGAFSAVGSFISGVWEGIVSGLIGFINKAIDVINGMTGTVSKAWTWTGLVDAIPEIPKVEVPFSYKQEGDGISTDGGSGVTLAIDGDPTGYNDTISNLEANTAGKIIDAPGLDTSKWDSDVGASLEQITSAAEGAEIDFGDVDTASIDAAGEAAEAAHEKLNSLQDVTLPDLSGATSDMDSLTAGIDTAKSDLAELESALSSFDLGAAGGEAGAGYMEGLANTDASGAASSLTTNAENAVRAAQQSGSPAAAYMPIGAEAAQGYGMGLQQEDVSSYAQGFAAAAMAAVSAATQAEAAALTLEAEGSTVIQTFSAGMTAGSPAALAVMKVLGVAIRAVAQAVNLTAQGSNMLRTLTSGMNSGRSAAVNSARTTGSGIKSAFSSINLYSIGSNIVAGLRNGMQSMFSSLLATARSMAAQLRSTIQSGMQVHSPSRFTDWIGRMTGQGLIEGLEGTTKKVAAAAAAMALGVSSAFAPVAVAAPSFDMPQAVTMDYPSVTAPQPLDVSPYQTIGQHDNDFSGSTNERHIIIDLKGGGKIEVTGLTKEKAIELISEQLKPQLSAILAEEIFEGGDGVYEF